MSTTENTTEYGSLREKISAEKAERKALQEKWSTIVAHAIDAGLQAGNAAVPQPMIVGSPRNLAASLLGLDDGGLDPNEPQYYVSEGVCGFAWITLYAKSGEGKKFVNWLTGNAKPQEPHLAPQVSAHKAYRGGHQIWVSEFGQSMQRKEAYAQAAAEYLRNAGIDGLSAYAGSRMD